MCFSWIHRWTIRSSTEWNAILVAVLYFLNQLRVPISSNLSLRVCVSYSFTIIRDYSLSIGKQNNQKQKKRKLPNASFSSYSFFILLMLMHNFFYLFLFLWCCSNRKHTQVLLPRWESNIFKTHTLTKISTFQASAASNFQTHISMKDIFSTD